MGVYVSKMLTTQNTLNKWSLRTKENCDDLTGKDKQACLATSGYIAQYGTKFGSIITSSRLIIKNVPRPAFNHLKRLQAQLKALKKPALAA